MFMTRITMSRRVAGAPQRRTRPAAADSPVLPDASLDASWEAIVAQLRATPAEGRADEPAAPEYAWARRLGMHINRPPKRSHG